MKKVLTLALVVMLACTSLFVLGASAEGAVAMKIATWTSNEAQLALLQSFVDGFAAEKGITLDVTFESIPFAEYNTKLLLELQGNAAPDAFWILENTAPAFASSGMLKELDGALAAANPEDLTPSAMELWQMDGKTYAVPFSTSPFFVVYNADLFAQAGAKTPGEYMAEGAWTWDAFREASKAIKDATGKWGFMTVDAQGYDARILHNLVPMIRSFGGDAWTADGTVTIDQPEAVQAVQLFHDMLFADASVVPPGDESNFFTGDAAMTACQISRLSNLKDVTWKWDMVPMPAGPAGQAPVIGQAAIGAFSGGPNAELAAELVVYMTNEASVAAMAGIWPPARKSVLESEGFLSSNAAVTPEQMKSVVAASIDAGRVLPAHLNYMQMDAEAKIVFDKLWTKDADVAAILGEVAQVYRTYTGK